MRVEYRLDFEDYLELQKHRYRQPDYSQRNGAILFGIILIGLAGAVEFQQQDSLRYVAFILIVAGAASLVFGAYLGRRAPRQTRETDERQLRHEFDAFSADSRVFEAEAQGWMVQSAYGEDRRGWNHLSFVKEEARLITLATTWHWYPIPKRVFSPADRESLREWALRGLQGKSQICKTQIRHSALEWIWGQTWHYWKHHTGQRLLVYALGILTVVFFLFQAASHEGLGSQLYGGIAGFLGFALLVGEVGFYYSQCRANPDWQKVLDVQLFRDRILYAQDETTWALRMKQVMRIEEIPTLFLLYFESDRFYHLPKSCLPSEAIAQLREVALHVNKGAAVDAGVE